MVTQFKWIRSISEHKKPKCVIHASLLDVIVFDVKILLNQMQQRRLLARCCDHTTL